MYCEWPILGRCCFYVPLRKGVLTFGYINLMIGLFVGASVSLLKEYTLKVFSTLMVGIYCLSIYAELDVIGFYHGSSVGIGTSKGVCIAIYFFEAVFTTILVYGTHKKLINYIKIYYYFAVTTTVASFLVQIIDCLASVSDYYMLSNVLPLMLASLAIQVYLIILLKSLLKKMEESPEPQGYENEPQQIVYEGKVESNVVYDLNVVPVDV